MRYRSSFPVLATAMLMATAQSQDPATVAVDKHASYTVATDGWPYAFLPDGNGFYMMVGGMTRAPKALRYDSTGHKSPARTGIDLTRRSTDMATWRLEDGKIFNVVFGSPEEASGEGEIIWGFVDPLKEDPAEPHTIGKLENADKNAPLAWNSSTVKVDGHHAFWVVPHLKKKECASLAVAAVNWRTGKARTQEVLLPKPLEGLKVVHLATNEAGDALLSLMGIDPSIKKDGWAEGVSLLLSLKADGTVGSTAVSVPGHFSGCTACLLENSGMARCVGFAVNDDKSTPAIIHASFLPGPQAVINWAVGPLDDEQDRQLADRARDPKEMESSKPAKVDPKEHTEALAGVRGKLRPIHLEMLAGDSLLFVAEVQVRNEYLGEPSGANQAGNLRDQLLYAYVPPSGTPRTGVVRKYIVEEGAPGYGEVARTAVMAHGSRLYFFFNDWERHAFEKGATPTDKYARINVATMEGAGIFDPMVHVEGPNGPIERTAIQRSMQLDYMMNGCTIQAEPGTILIALTKGRGIQWMKVDAKP